MALLITDEIPWMTQEIYDGMAAGLIPQLQKAPGFLSHFAGPMEGGGFSVAEIWASEAEHSSWFEATVKPNLPPDAVVNRSVRQLVNVASPA